MTELERQYAKMSPEQRKAASETISEMMGMPPQKDVKSSEIRLWGIHSTDDMLFFNKNVIAIGWAELGDLSNIPADREAFREKMMEVYPEAKKQAIATNTGQVYRFVHEMQVGDYIVFPSKKDRMGKTYTHPHCIHQSLQLTAT